MDTSPLKSRAKEAIERRNYDYAIELYRQILKLTPDDADSRRELRAVEIRQSKEHGNSSFGKVAAGLQAAKALLMLSLKKYDAAIEAAEDALVKDPGHVSALMTLGRAAAAAGYLDCAVVTFEDLRSAAGGTGENRKKAVKAARELAYAYENVGRIEDALNVWAEVARLIPGDHEAGKKSRDLSAGKMTRTLEEGAKVGGGGGAISHTVVKDMDEVRRGQIKVSEIRTDEDLELALKYTKEDLKERPDDPRLHDKMGDLYRRGHRYEEALAAYKTAREKDPANPMYLFKQHDVEIVKKRNALKELAAKVQAGEAGAKEKHDRLSLELTEYSLNSYLEREKQYSTDANIRFRLGLAFFELADRKNDFSLYDEAIKRFQSTFRDPKFRVESGLRMGLGFASKKQYDLALKRFEETLAGLELKDDRWKNLVYAKADTLEKKGEKKKSLEAFLQIYEIDVGFRDVAGWIEKLQKEVEPGEEEGPS